MQPSIFLGLGSNQGDSLTLLRQAVQAIGVFAASQSVGEEPQIQVSPLYRSAPVDTPNPQADYWNAAMWVVPTFLDADLDSLTTSAYHWLNAMQAIEHQRGRTRTHYHAERTLDIDLLSFGTLILNHPNLTLPHPAMTERRFVMAPLFALAPDAEIPTLGRIAELYATLMHRPHIEATQALTCIANDQRWCSPDWQPPQ